MKHLVVYIMGFVAVTCLLSCKQKPVEVITMNHTRPIEELKQLVLLKGDTAAYDELFVAFMDQEYTEEYLIYSILMAHKYNYPSAYFGVYCCLVGIYKDYGITMDEKTRKMAIDYLKKGAELKNCSSLGELRALYKEGRLVPKDTHEQNVRRRITQSLWMVMMQKFRLDLTV